MAYIVIGETFTFHWGGDYEGFLSDTVDIYYSEGIEGSLEEIELGVANVVDAVNEYVWTHGFTEETSNIYIWVVDTDMNAVKSSYGPHQVVDEIPIADVAIMGGGPSLLISAGII